MLYIFLVDTGVMLHFDMSLTTETVQTLKEHVEHTTKLPVGHQVMLISGGECLDSTKRVCSYPSGTDTNPIYLFSRAAHMYELPNQQFKDLRDEEELLEEVKSTAVVPPSFQIIDKRAHLAEQFKESAINLLMCSKQLVCEQHYQHQGWAAVIANCEDLLLDFKFRYEQLKVDFREYVDKKKRFNGFFERFKGSVRLLRKIPLLPKLQEIYDTKKFLTQSTDNEVSQSSSEEVNAPNLKLFDWIGTDEHGDDIEMKYEKCLLELTKYSVEQFNKISSEVEKILTTAGDPSMKEIKGLGPMLFQLDKFIQDAEKKVREQIDCASSIVLNQNRINNLRDSSILPDLCASHVNQLSSMAESHRSLMNIYIACTKGKMEFNKNLSLRFPWLKHVHNAMQNLSDHMDVFSENISNLKYQLDILEQVDVAPVAYLSCVTEIVRRRSFTQAFLNCTSKLVSRLSKIHNEEVTRRNDFKSKFEGHFINILFPGMRDQPPGYGIYQPAQFDIELPELTQEDIEFLKAEVPEMIEYLSVTDPSYSTYNSLFKSLLHIEYDKGKEDIPPQIILKDAMVQSEISDYVRKNISKAMKDTSFINVHGLPYLKDLDKGCESETDTEEFEKVGQSPLDLNFEKDLSSIVSNTQDASTLTEVGDRSHIPPRKPPRSFQKLPSIQTTSVEEVAFHRTLSISGSQSNSESFTNIKNPSLESIDELLSLKNVSSNTESCFNSHYQQQMICGSVGIVSQYMSSPISPKYHVVESPKSPVAGHQTSDFVNDEFYIDESLPSSLSIETGQSQGEFGKQLDTANTVVALLQDNLDISRSEFDKLKSLVMQMGYLASQTIIQLKSEIEDLKCRHSADKSIISNHLQQLNSSFENLRIQQNEHDDVFNQMSYSHSNEISDFRKMIQVKNEEIKSCRSNILFLEQKVKTISNELTVCKEVAVVNEEKRMVLEKMLNDLENEKEKSIKEVSERLNREHRDEIKTLQARFKLMTMERTPSESSLEKTLECSSYTNHESIINQMTENFEIEKEKVVKETITKEREKWKKVVEQLNENFEQEKSKLIDQGKDKECQIRDLQNREKLLLDEIERYTSTIEQLSKNEAEDLNVEMMDKIEALESEKSALSSELKRVTERLEMTTSAVYCTEGKLDSSTSPIRQQKSLSKSFTVPSGKMNKLSLDYLKPGDPVVVVWDDEYENFRIVQDSPVIYFLHSECVKSLDLEIYDEYPRVPNKFYCLAEYVLREYCIARKSKNRYRVPRGTRFFQVKAKPLEHKNIPEHCEMDTQMTQSNLTSNRTLSESSTTELDFHSLPSSPKLTPDIKDSRFENSSEVVHDIPSESEFLSADTMNFLF
ncbi:hypothetical protein WA026_017047 [Henosepilachna vigintioctopunctata]|uniref:RB1-inducible coiled-coil protein 1 n=1 Tax=Henosepilachna vigintioctopunctata TaxID=420089 RepID=A0AAW1TLJ2_9CUCU